MKIDRLIGILSVLLKQEKVTAPELAARFEVSRRTINRDIEDICRAGIPIVTRQGVNGGISIMEGYRIDKTLLTASDLKAIFTGLKSLDSISGNNRYRQLMEKLAPPVQNAALSETKQTDASSVPSVPIVRPKRKPSVSSDSHPDADEHIRIDLSSFYKDSLAPKIERLHRAIEEHELVCFQYYGPNGTGMRVIEPYLLVFQWESWYIWGFCLDRQDYRMFKLNRLAELNGKGEFFVPREYPEFDNSPERPFVNENILMTAVFEPQAKWRLIEEYGLNCYTDREDGKLTVKLGFTNKDVLFSWLLGFGSQAELVEPEELRKEFVELVDRIYGKYHIG